MPDPVAYNRAAIVLVATVPATMTAALVLVFNIVVIPVWLQASALVLIISVESLICFFSYELASAALAAKSSYDELLKLAADVKKPLMELKDFLLEWKDLLPDLTQLLKAIPKERVRSELLKMVDHLRKLPPPANEADVLKAAARLSERGPEVQP